MALQFRRLTGILILAAAIGCPKSVSAPTATIQPGPSAVQIGSVVIVDGSKSKDPDGRDLTFNWSFTQLPLGSAAVLNDAHAMSPSFLADVDGTYGLQLIVSNAFLQSAAATISINVSKCGGRAPVISAVNAANDSNTKATAFGVGSLVGLSADVADPDNSTADGICATQQGQAVTYAWKMIGQPASSTATLNNPTAAAPSFVADVAGDYKIRLVVTDSTGRASPPTDSTFTAGNCGAQAPSISGQIVTTSEGAKAVGSAVQLSLSVDDPDNSAACQAILAGPQTLSFQWSIPQLPKGSRAQLNNANAQTPSFTPDIDGDYQVQAVVTDSTGLSASATQTFTVPHCGNNAPVATITGALPTDPAPTAGHLGGLLQFGESIADADKDSCGLSQSFTSKWSFYALPAGSNAQLNAPQSTNPSFTPDVAGTYIVQLVATDQSGLFSAPAFASVQVQKLCGTQAPGINSIATTDSLLSYVFGTTVQLTADASDPDNNAGCALGQSLSYAWTLVSKPASSNAFIQNPTTDPAVTPAKFVADVPNGTYQVQLIVTDSTGLASAPKFISIGTSDCGTQAPTIASAAADKPNPNPKQLVTLTATGDDADNHGACNLAQGLSFQWTLVSRPSNSGAALTVKTSPADGSSSSFTPDVIGAYQLSATVTDSTGLTSAPSFVTVTTTACGSNAPTVVASANSNSVSPLTQVTLNAVASSADDSCLGAAQTEAYAWSIVSRPAGSSSVLSDPTSSAPKFTPDVPGNYQFQVIATDEPGLTSEPAFVNVTATSCSLVAPSVAALAATTGTQFSPVTLPLPAVTDTNCLASATHLYRWALVTTPPGSASVLDDPTLARPTFTPDRVGSYQLSLTVTNSMGVSSAPVFLTVPVGTCGNAQLGWAAQAVTVGKIQDPDLGSTSGAPNIGAQVTLVPHPTDSNNCGAHVSASTNTYQWAIIAAPHGSRAALSASTDPSPTLVPDVQGTYQLSVIATDALGNSSATPGFISFDTSTCGANQPTVSINPATTATPSNASVALTATPGDADLTACPARFHSLTFSYAWSLTAQPAGGKASITSSTGPSTSFIAQSAGSYQVHVVATASNGLATDPASSGSFAALNVAACGSSAPVINSLATTAHGLGTVVSRPAVGQAIDVTVNATDADAACGVGGAIAQYSFTAVSLPSGSAVAASTSAASPIFTLTPDVAGTYLYSVVATDSTGLSSQPVEISISTAACGPVLAGITPSVGGTALLVTGANVASTVSGNTVSLNVAAPADTCVRQPSFAYAWQLTQKPAASQSVLSTLTSTTTTLSPDVPGTYAVEITATDNAGLTSAPQTLTLAVASCGTAKPVIGALTAAPASPNAGALVTLNQPAITDANAGSCNLAVTPFAWRWSLISTPAGSSAELSSQTAAAPEFVADLPHGTYQVALTVTDALGNVSDPAFLAVTSTLCGANAPALSLSATSGAPNANTSDALSASATDADSACSGFATVITGIDWSIVQAPAGAHASLSASHSVPTSNGLTPPTFSSANHFQADTAGTYVVQGIATASNGLRSAAALTTLNVTSCGTHAPVITGITTTDALSLTPVSRPSLGEAVVLTAAETDPDETLAACPGGAQGPAQFLWTLASEPAGSAVSVPAAAQSAGISFTPDVAGAYVFNVIAVDAQGLQSEPSSVTIATGACGPQVANSNNWPSPISVSTNGSVSFSNNAFDVTQGAAVNLSTGAISDTCVVGGADPTLSWSLTSRPAGSSAALSFATTATPSFVADAAGIYGVQLVVTDSGGFSSVFTTAIDANACTSGPQITSGGLQPLPITALYTATDPDVGTTATIFSGDRVQLQMPLAGPANGGLLVGSCSSVVSYQWSMISRPAGSQSVLSSSADAQPAFVPDVAGGDYQFALVVRDGLGNASPPYFFTLPTTSTCGARAPVAQIATAGGHANAAITFNASVPSDPNIGCPARFFNAAGYTFAFALTSQPVGAAASLTSSGASSTALLTNAGGSYTVAATATSLKDHLVGAPASATIAVSQCGAFPPVAQQFAVSQRVNITGGSTTIGDSPAATGFTTLAGGAAASAVNYYLSNALSVTALTVADADTGVGCGLAAQTNSYSWALTGVPAGSTARLTSSGAATVFTPDVSGTYTLSLTSTDSAGYSSTSTVAVAATCGGNSPSVANLTGTQTVPGTGSLQTPAALAMGFPIAITQTTTDADTTATGACTVAEAQPLAWQWTLSSVPAGSTATVLAATTPAPSFTPDVAGNYTIRGTATDPQGHTGTAAITISATCDAAAPAVALTGGVPDFTITQAVPQISTATGAQALTVSRSAGNANTGTLSPSGTVSNGQLLYPGYPATLTANVPAVSDACSIPQTATYQWSIASQPSGSVAALNNPAAKTPSFTPDVQGTYAFQLKLTGQNGLSTTTQLSLNTGAASVASVGTCGRNAPVASAASTAALPGASQAPNSAVSLDASASTAPDAAIYPGGCGLPETLAYNWVLNAQPSGSAASIANPATVAPQFTADKSGTYTATVTVSANGLSSQRSTSVTLNVASNLSTSLGASSSVFTSTDSDASGKPVVALWDNAAGTLNVQRCTANCATSNATWTTLPQLASFPSNSFAAFSSEDAPRPVSLKVSPTGNLFVAWYGGLGDCSAHISTWNGATWSSINVFSGVSCGSDVLHGGAPASGFSAQAMGRFVSLDVDAATGLPLLYVSLQETDNNSGTVTDFNEATIWNFNVTGGVIQSANVGVGLGSTARFGAVRVQSAGRADFFQYAEAGTGLQYYACTSGCLTGGPAWSSATTIDNGTADVGRFVSAAAIKNGTTANPGASPILEAVYRDTTGKKARLARCTLTTSTTCTTAANWSTTVISDTSTDYGKSAAITVDPTTGYPRVAYHDAQAGTVKLLLGGTSSTFSTLTSFTAASTPSISLGFGTNAYVGYATSSGPALFVGP